MNSIFSSAERPLSAEHVLSLRPLRVAQLTRGWAVDVTAADLVMVAGPVDATRQLSARRGHLGATEANSGLARMLEERPEDFGAVGCIVLGADTVEVQASRGLFGDSVHIIGPECIDGMQRLKVIADMRHRLPYEHLQRAVVRLEIRRGPERDRARRVHDVADRLLNPSTAQDRLIRCPNIVNLMRGDWEKGYFDPRRGMTAGPRGRRFSMADVTSALACLSAAPQPVAANLAATPGGREALWEDHASPVYRSLFHRSMTPVGVMRAVEAWESAHAALAAMPKRARQGYGHLIEYAPELICWKACRSLTQPLPLHALHDAMSAFPWEKAIEHDLPAATVRTARSLVARYQAARPERTRPYKSEAPELELWKELVG
ncbi:hypothetical protein [Streptomyces geranii]|uniref:hypothetical protein n=1 Tax=Streptomyces geranii TaxID=2058923 RepID=UPI000D0445D5|nr:hypothetical protein [Streptomyces geranii]